MACDTDKRTRDIDKLTRGNKIISAGNTFIVIGLLFSIPVFIMLLFPGGPYSEPGFIDLIMAPFWVMGPGFLGLGVILRIAGQYFYPMKGIRALMHHCPNCNFESSAKKPEFKLCPSCKGLMELSVQCKQCSNWFDTSLLGRIQCPQCKLVILI